MRTTSVAAITVIALSSSAASLAQESSVVLKQSGTPLEITKYSAYFQAESPATSFSRGNLDQISHSVTYKNVSGKEIVALQIGLTSFDAFNGFMGSFNGWSTDRLRVGEVKSGTWAQRPYAAFAFNWYGTGVAYVNAVRFADSSIWRANLAEVLVELQKFEKELKREDLVDPKK